VSRILIVSNRLPVTASIVDGELQLDSSAGGLATGLRGPHERSHGLWLGWPGELPRLTSAQQRELDRRLEEMRLVPVHLGKREVKNFYEGISNGVIWPLFHYQTDQLTPEVQGWPEYREANEHFARMIAERLRPHDIVWVHDYHLMLVPGILRQIAPDARIGFFLHIPFPSSELFSLLPWREELLKGLLGADLIGFHTPSYLRHFATTIQRVLGQETDIDHVLHDGRDTRLGVFPMGVDVDLWSSRAEEPAVYQEAESIREEARGRKIIIGIDRLDYTKGLEPRLAALDRLFSKDSSLAEKVRFIQVTVPSREGVEAYAGLRRRIDELVGRINSTYATLGAVPVHRLHRAMSERDVAALYAAADVLLVTPLRDGMNLVAKEFVAVRNDEDGVLVLSEFAGAANELGEALHVNPYDLDALAATIQRALTMPRDERRERMKALRHRVRENDVDRWASDFLNALTAERTRAAATGMDIASMPLLRRLFDRLRPDQDLVVLIDYDGTLVPFAERPIDAVPDQEALDLLQRLAARPRTRVHVISGRSRASIEKWLGHLPLGLHAEHGLWSRVRSNAEWRTNVNTKVEWREPVHKLMEHFTSTTGGTFIEEKTASIAWHYRNATADHSNDASFGDVQARELRLLLNELLSNAPVEVIAGNKVVEVRPHGLHKGIIVPGVLADAPEHALLVALGDDRTDEDLFAALPDGSITIKVGGGDSRGLYRISNVEEARRVIGALAGIPEPGRRSAALR
jgi:trehalose 6-phosphate synthase/phosphatase